MINWLLFGLAVIILLAFIGKMFLDILHEAVDYNGGVCPDCGKNLTFLFEDEDGDRYYHCPKCEYSVWVSYDCVDGGGREL